MVLPGSFPVHDLPDLGVELPEGPYATVAGLVLDRLGHLPAAGEIVLPATDRAIPERRKALVGQLPPEEAPAPGAQGGIVLEVAAGGRYAGELGLDSPVGGHS